MIRITHMRDQPLPDQHRLAGLRGWDEKASMPRPSPSNTEYYLGMIRITHMRDQPLPDQHRLAGLRGWDEKASMPRPLMVFGGPYSNLEATRAPFWTRLREGGAGDGEAPHGQLLSWRSEDGRKERPNVGSARKFYR